MIDTAFILPNQLLLKSAKMGEEDFMTAGAIFVWRKSWDEQRGPTV